VALASSPTDWYLANFNSHPDASLWSDLQNWSDGDRFYAGYTLKATSSRGTLVRNELLTFEATTNGYVVLPPVVANDLRSFTVGLKVERPSDAPDAPTLVETLATVKDGLESAGYVKVTVDAVSSGCNLTFDIPIDQLPDSSSSSKLLFDFASTPVPENLSIYDSTGVKTTAQVFPSVTAARVSGIRFSYAKKKKEGLAVILR